MEPSTRKASSSTAGFFQSLPVVPPQYTPSPSTTTTPNHNTSDDPILSRILSIYLPTPIPSEISTHLHDFARQVIHPSTLRHTVSCDVDLPTLHSLTTFGEENRVDSLHTSEGWRELKKIQTPAGVVGHGYPQERFPNSQSFNRRLQQYSTLHLWHGSCAVSTCPMAMTDGAAVLLRRHLDDPDGDQPGRNLVFRHSYNRLVSLDNINAWTSGQWMTERTGGSDVRGTETVARRMTPQEIRDDDEWGRDTDAHGLPLGPWLIDGFKWFSSATDADMTVMLAQTSKGLSAFYAPLRRRVANKRKGIQFYNLYGAITIEEGRYPSELNGIRIQRLKSKLGTKGVPTAELELKSTRAYLIGEEGQGVKEIASILNITRLHTASAAVGYLARGLAVSRAYTLIRRIREGQLLRDNAQHLAWMAGESVKYRANAHLVFFGVALLGASEQGYAAVTRGTQGSGAAKLLIPQTKEKQDLLLRLLTPVMKAQTGLNGVAGLRACMESLGGVGYCENNEDGGILNIARIFRDSVVNSIWEGTTSVLAEDVLRVVKNPKLQGRNFLDDNLGAWVRSVLAAVEAKGPQFAKELAIVRNRYAMLERTVRTQELAALQRKGRDVLEHIEAVTCACLLMIDALVDADDVAIEVARRWVRLHALPADKVKIQAEAESVDGARELDMDRRIFLGPSSSSREARL